MTNLRLRVHSFRILAGFTFGLPTVLVGLTLASAIGLSLGMSSALAVDCKVQVPPPLFRQKPAQFKSYQATHGLHEIRETGELPDGSKFSLYRGGCVEYGETLVFTFRKGTHSVNDTPFWLTQAGQVLAKVGKAALQSGQAGTTPMAGAFERSEQILRVVQQWNPQTSSPDSVQLGPDQVDVVIEAMPNGLIKVQLNINDGL